ncbi:MAG: hypothetical protein KDJ87_16045 [Rhizobiaceae bacterium]|nr:hypothetical protein [Rhizobiaceae bacterium]
MQPNPLVLVAGLLAAVAASTGGARAQDAFSLDDPAAHPLDSLKLNGFSPTIEQPAHANSPVKTVRLEAKLSDEGMPMKYGLSWRIFSPIPGPDGKLPMLASSEGGSTSFELPTGDYFVHVAFGRAGATKKLRVSTSEDPPTQVLVLDAGGMVLNAVSGSDMRIPPDELTFAIYASEAKDDGERGLIMDNVRPNQIVRLNAGTYHVVSDYGAVNATIRADIKIEAGRLTQAVIQHRAAKITLKLVSQTGGEAIADTAWSILTASGDSVAESVGAFPVVVLAEGNYTAVARHKNNIYQRDFKVEAGRNQDVEVLLAK